MKLIQLFIDTAKIDVFALHPNAFHEPLANNYQLYLNRFPKRTSSFFPRTRKFVYFCCRTIWHTVKPCKVAIPNIDNKIAFLWETKNQQSSLQPIFDQLPSATTTSHLNTLEPAIKRFGIPFWISLLCTPALLLSWLRGSQYERQAFKYALDHHLYTYGMYFCLRLVFARSRPTAIVFSNDHLQFPCVLSAAAIASGIKTIYVQHACVTDRFPPLRMDYAFLDGLDAKQKYLAAGETQTNILLTGPTRMDGYQEHINRKTEINAVGVCFSVSDRECKILELLETLLDLDEYRIVLRPHMAMNRQLQELIEKFAISNRFEYSRHDQVSALEFMKSVDLLISGASSIALEGAMMNLTVVNYQLNPDEKDWYGFIENGLMDSIDQPSELKQFFKRNRENRVGNRKNASRYVATLDTEFDGRSAIASCQKITSICR